MRVLFLTSQLPYPPHGGGPLRTYGFLDGLHRAGHTIDLLSFHEGPPGSVPEALTACCAAVHTVRPPTRTGKDRLRDLLFSGWPDLLRRFESPAFSAKLRDLLSTTCYDVVHVVSLEMAAYLPLLKAVRPCPHIVYDALNAEASLQRMIYLVDRASPPRWPLAVYSLMQARRLAAAERQICRMADRVVAVSEADAAEIKRLAPEVDAAIVPNGIFAAEYVQTSQQLDLGSAAILFTGTMNYRPNVDAVLWFAEAILPEVRRAVPDAHLFVVGIKPHSRLDSLRSRKDLTITGFVPDVKPFLRSAAVYVAPLRMGSGTRLKLLQAMAAGMAVVSTPLGAEGLRVSNGSEMLVAEDAERFAKAVIVLLRDPALREKLGKTAQAFVYAQYDWSVIVPHLLSVYEGLRDERP